MRFVICEYAESTECVNDGKYMIDAITIHGLVLVIEAATQKQALLDAGRWIAVNIPEREPFNIFAFPAGMIETTFGAPGFVVVKRIGGRLGVVEQYNF